MSSIKKLSLFHYNIGFFDFNADILTGLNMKIHWLKHPYKDRFFADPFILDVRNDEIKVLVEEFVYKDWKGRISLLTIDKHSFCLKSTETLLELESHLSFPFIYREKGEIYVIPENSASGSLSAYKYIGGELHKCNKLINEPVIDPVVIKINDRYFLLGSILGKNENSDLFIWESDRLLGSYKMTGYCPVLNNMPECARRGGDFFDFRGKTYSAVQNCRYNYGESLNICNVKKISGSELDEQIITILHPDSRYKYGLHTFNMFDDLCVVDGLTYLFRPLHKLIFRLKNRTR